MAESDDELIEEIPRAAPAAPAPRKLEHKPDIAPIAIRDFDECHAYLRGIVRKHFKAARRSFRALQIAELFEEHHAALIEAVREAVPDDKRSKVNYDSVKWFFINPSAVVCSENNAVITEALAAKLNELVELPKSELNADGVDEELQRLALDNPDCPRAVTDFAFNRPSAFAVFVSDYTYRPEIVSLYRGMISDNERGKKSRTTADMIQEVFPAIAKVGK